MVHAYGLGEDLSLSQCVQSLNMQVLYRGMIVTTYQQLLGHWSGLYHIQSILRAKSGIFCMSSPIQHFLQSCLE